MAATVQHDVLHTWYTKTCAAQHNRGDCMKAQCTWNGEENVCVHKEKLTTLPFGKMMAWLDAAVRARKRWFCPSTRHSEDFKAAQAMDALCRKTMGCSLEDMHCKLHKWKVMVEKLTREVRHGETLEKWIGQSDPSFKKLRVAMKPSASHSGVSSGVQELVFMLILILMVIVMASMSSHVMHALPSRDEAASFVRSLMRHSGLTDMTRRFAGALTDGEQSAVVTRARSGVVRNITQALNHAVAANASLSMLASCVANHTLSIAPVSVQMEVATCLSIEYGTDAFIEAVMAPALHGVMDELSMPSDDVVVALASHGMESLRKSMSGSDAFNVEPLRVALQQALHGTSTHTIDSYVNALKLAKGRLARSLESFLEKVDRNVFKTQMEDMLDHVSEHEKTLALEFYEAHVHCVQSQVGVLMQSVNVFVTQVEVTRNKALIWLKTMSVNAREQDLRTLKKELDQATAAASEKRQQLQQSIDLQQQQLIELQQRASEQQNQLAAADVLLEEAANELQRAEEERDAMHETVGAWEKHSLALERFLEYVKAVVPWIGSRFTVDASMPAPEPQMGWMEWIAKKLSYFAL